MELLHITNDETKSPDRPDGIKKNQYPMLDEAKLNDVESSSHVTQGQRRCRHRYKIFKTVLMSLGPVAMAIYLELSGAALSDLKRLVGVNYEQISRALVARSVGYLSGSLLSGLVLDWKPGRDYWNMVLFLAFGVAASGTLLIPFTPHFTLLCLGFFLQGLGQGATDTSANGLCALMWGSKAALPLNCLHLGYGIGAFIAPQMARPYLLPAHNLTSNVDTTANPSNDSIYDQIESVKIRIHIPYTISAALTLAFFLAFLVCFLVEKGSTFEQRKSNKDIEHPEDASTEPLKPEENDRLSRSDSIDKSNPKQIQESNNIDKSNPKQIQESNNIHESDPKQVSESDSILNLDPKQVSESNDAHESSTKQVCFGKESRFKYGFLFMLVIFFMNVVGGERVISKFVFTFSEISDFQFDSEGAAGLTSLFWACFLAGRISGTLLTKICLTRHLLVSVITIHLLGAIMLAFVSGKLPIFLWISIGVIGFTLAPMFPGFLVLANDHVELRGMTVSLVFIGSSLGGMSYQWLTGLLFEYAGPTALVYEVLTYSILILVAFISVLFLIRGRPRRDFVLQ